MIRVTRSAVIDAPIERVWAVLRDFNSHLAWHPAIAESSIENGEAGDQIGCIRNFSLKDGHHIREQLLALSDEAHLSTYCILDATLPMRRYVATLQLKRVTDGERTFWHWQSTFDVPAGREAEFEKLVGEGVYEGGFAGLRAWLRRGASEAGDTPGRSAGPSSRLRPVGGPTGAAIPAQVVKVLRFGGAEVLSHENGSVPSPAAGEVRIRQTAVGVNYIDVAIRKGQHRMIAPPAVLGMEAAGIVVDVGAGVAHILPGDRVAYASAVVGSYASVRTIPANEVVVLPDDVPDEIAAALMLKGMSACYLLHQTARVGAGDAILVHAAAGGVGLLLCQWAKALGARVFGTVSTQEKARIARANGCDHPVITPDYRFADDVLAATHGDGIKVIFDGLGRAAQDENLRVLSRCGHWVSFGQASGMPDAVPLEKLGEKSLTMSCPALFDYTHARRDLERLANATFDAWRARTIRIEIRHRFPLAEAALAHRELEARRTIGPVLLLP